ncbi:unnamed protein product [Caenorhabditis nigoni]
MVQDEKDLKFDKAFETEKLTFCDKPDWLEMEHLLEREHKMTSLIIYDETEQDANNIIKQSIDGKPGVLNNSTLHVETDKTDLEVFKDFAEYELDAEDNKSNDTKKNRKRFNIYRKCDGRKAVVELDDENGIHCTIE